MRGNTSEQILETAMQMVQTRGYNAFSYADISDVVGIRKASIHYHFPTKSHLGQALIRRYRQDLAKSLQKLRDESNDARTQLLGLVRLYEAGLQNQQLDLGGILGASIATLPAEVQAEVRATFEELVAWIAETIQQGCDAGTLAREAAAEIEAQALLANIHGAQAIARAAGWQPEQFVNIVSRAITDLQA